MTARPPSARPARISAFAAAMASTVPSSSRCTGPTLVITPTSGSAIAELGDLAEASHRHLEDQHLGLHRVTQDGQRQPDLGVEVLPARVHPPRESARLMSLDRRLSRRARDADGGKPSLAAPGASQPLERAQRVGTWQHPATGLGVVELRRQPPEHGPGEWTPRAVAEDLAAKRPAVGVDALRPKKRSPALTTRESMTPRSGTVALSRGRRRTRPRPRSALGARLRSPGRRPASSLAPPRATARSSNGGSAPPSNS